MNKRLENKLTAYEGMTTLFHNNVETVDSVLMLKESVEDFETTVAAVRLKSSEMNGATTGKAAAKYQAEDDLIAALLPIAAALYIYATKKNDVELKEKTKIIESRLRLMRDTELASRGEVIADLAEVHLADLASANINAAMVANLKLKAQVYRAAIGVRESSVAGRIGARTTMEELFKKADEILEDEIDSAMELIRTKNTQFYNEYFTLRVVKDTGARHRPEAAPVTPQPTQTPAT